MATLLLENGPDKGKGLELSTGGTYTLGRDPGCDLVVTGDLVSRHHCRVKEFKGAYFVKDLESLNGIFLNDERVTQAELKPGDKLQLGDIVLTFLDESLAKSKEEKTLGGYRLLERVGRGGMGTVYRAIQVSLDREVALKLLSPELVKDKNFVAQFFREARAAGQLNHPHIVQVYDVGHEGETYFYSMEYVRGGSLEDRLRDEGKLAPNEALRIALEAAMALEYAESRHIVHRDIKPDNLMLAEDGRVRVADLGLALSLKSGADQKGQPILGTPHFISPEQALRREIDIRSDIYSLGATLYRMLTGETLFTGATAEEIVKKAVREEPRPLREVNPAVPERVAALVHRMVQKDPAARFASAKELREALQRLLHQPARTKALIGLGAVAVLAVGTAIVFALKKPEKETVIVEAPGAEEARKRAFEAKSDADKRKIELEAVRAYLDVVEKQPPRDQAKEALLAWLKSYDYLKIPEHDRVNGRIQAIDDANARDVQARKDAEAAQAARVAALKSAVEEPLGKGDFAGALAHALVIAPEQESDPAAKSALAAMKLELLDATQKKLEAETKRRRDEIEALAQAGDLAGAAARCDEAAATFPAPPADLADPYRGDLQALHDGFAQRKAQLETTARANAEAVAGRDARRLADAFDAGTRRQVLALDFAAAAERLAKLQGELETDGARARLAPVVRTLERGAALFARGLAALEGGTLAAEPPIKLAGQDRGGELTGWDRDKRAVKLKISNQRGGVSTSVPLLDFASADGLRQLFGARMELTAEERADFGELMVLVDVERWLDHVAPLADRLARYNPDEGWTDALREGLEAPPTFSFAADVRALLKDGAADGRGAEVAAHAEAEERCEGDFATALDPLIHANSNVGWSAAADALKRVVTDHRATLLQEFARPWIEGS